MVATVALSLAFVAAILELLVDSGINGFDNALWWAIVTVTTVGYGDVVPVNGVGRVVGAVFMLEAIAFVAIVTAAITSSFVERARQERAEKSATSLDAQLADITDRLEQIQRALGVDGASPGRHAER